MNKIERKVEQLLVRMTLTEKALLLAGGDAFSSAAIQRLGIPSLLFTDGPHGIRIHGPYQASAKVKTTTAFPTGTSFGASWNPALIEKVGVALGEETRAMGWHVLLGPCINIIRHPLGGRSFEAFSEDPYLAGRLAVAYVRGVQREGVGTSVKHFACNNQEYERFRGNSVVDERTLREIYLPAFEATVKETKPWTVMCSYNRLNGEYAAQNHWLLTEVLKKEWGFDGIVVSDWNAVHATLPTLRAGLDLEMPGPGKWYAPGLLTDAVQNWQVDEAHLNEAVRRMLRLILRSQEAKRPGCINTPGHQRLARTLAEEAVTLLKNDRNALPLRTNTLRKIAVIGPNAAATAYNGGGSSAVASPHHVTLLQAIQDRLGSRAAIVHEEGCDHYFPELPPIEGEHWKTEFFSTPDWSGKPKQVRAEPPSGAWWGENEPIGPGAYSVRWTGVLRVPRSGRYKLLVSHGALCRVTLDGRRVIQDACRGYEHVRYAGGYVRLTAGQAYNVCVEFSREMSCGWTHVKVMFAYAPPAREDDRIQRAARAARDAEVAIVAVGGMPFAYETENRDREHMDLPGRQNELVRAVAKANPNTIVVVNCGAPVTMPWVDQVRAVVFAYYPGMEGGHAVADILTGKVNPSGKLPFTMPKRLEDTPAFPTYPGGREVVYREGVFVGYRHYDQHRVEPLFPFGHGLSYTTFEYSRLKVTRNRASVLVRNNGTLAGKEVVQLYIADGQSSVPRPPKELKGFAKIELKPGQAKEVVFRLDRRSFAFYDVAGKRWRVEPGVFEILAGSSSRDIRQRATLTLR